MVTQVIVVQDQLYQNQTQRTSYTLNKYANWSYLYLNSCSSLHLLVIDEDNWAPLIFSFNPIYLLSVVHFIVENLPSNLEKCSIINFYCKRRSTFNGRIVKLFKDAQVHVFCFHCINCYLFMGILKPYTCTFNSILATYKLK